MRRNRYGGLLLTAAFMLVGGTGATAIAQLPGDLDANGEVDLIDLTAFVGCLNGPDGMAVDPACDPADFDPASAPDADIDLRDFAGFQTRFGFGQGPPQIISFSPTPGEWVVNDTGLTAVTIGFSEPVVLPAVAGNAIDVWGLTSGTVNGFTTSYDPVTFVLTVSFVPPLRDDQVTVVVDYTIEDVAGHPLDGEILDPKNATLPSGNNINGGQGVFRIRVLQGDANRDGVVDTADLILINDSLNLCDGDPGFDVMADLNTDGCVDATDANIMTAALGNQLPVTDGTSPIVAEVIDSDGVPLATCGILNEVSEILIVFSEIMVPQRFTTRTCFVVDENGSIRVPSSFDLSVFGDLVTYNFVPPLPICDTCTINISNTLTDFSGELLVTPGAEPCP